MLIESSQYFFYLIRSIYCCSKFDFGVVKFETAILAGVSLPTKFNMVSVTELNRERRAPGIFRRS